MGKGWFVESSEPVNKRLAEATSRREIRIARTLKYLLPKPVWKFLVWLFPPEPTEEVHRLLLFRAAVGFAPEILKDPENQKLHEELEAAARESLRRRECGV